MDIFDEDLLSFWRALSKHGVRYIMVGGVATNLNGYQRTTDDIDVWLDDTLSNLENFRHAFRVYSGTDLTEIATMQYSGLGEFQAEQWVYTGHTCFNERPGRN